MLAAEEALEDGDPQGFRALVLVLRVFDEGLLFRGGAVVIVSLGGGRVVVVVVVVVVARGTVVAMSCFSVLRVVHRSRWGS